MDNKKELIVTIVKRGRSDAVLTASLAAGAKGGTVIFGRGTGIHERQKLFGIAVEPEKEIVFTVVDADQTDTVIDAIVKAQNLTNHAQAFFSSFPFPGTRHGASPPV
jgi:nitrogen regulatory protein PII